MSEQQTPKEPRNVGIVISQIKDLVPVENESLLNRLNAVLSSATFRAPEVQRITWGELAAVLTEELPMPPKEDWQFKVAAVFNDVSEEVVREEVRKAFGV